MDNTNKIYIKVRKPTIKQKKALTEAITTGVSIGQAMINNGYSPNTAKTPQKLTESQGAKKWLMDNFPDEMLANVALDGLHANKIHGTGDDFIEIPDHDARYKFWKDISKARGILVENGGQTNQQINIVLDNTGYIPPDNTLNLKPTKLEYTKK